VDVVADVDEVDTDAQPPTASANSVSSGADVRTGNDPCRAFIGRRTP